MLQFFQQNLNPVEIASTVVAGIFVILGLFGMGTRQRRQENDGLADSLISRLQKTVDQNAKDMQAMSARIDDQQKEIHVLQGKNEAYLQIITLRDPATAKVFDEAPEIYKIARETHEFAKQQVEALKALTNTMEKFINNLPSVMPTMTA